MKRIIFVSMLATLLAIPVSAQMGGGGMGGGHHGGGPGGMGGGMTGATMGSGMFAIADDNSLLVVDGHSGMAWDDEEYETPSLTNISAAGEERWSLSFDDGWPMMPVTAGDLVLVSVTQAIALDEGFPYGGGIGHGASVVVAYDLATGNELWSFEPETAAMLRSRISEDGRMIYIAAAEAVDTEFEPMNQGDFHFRHAGDSTLYALDQFGTVLWSLDLN